MIKDIVDEQRVEVLNTYTGQSITRLWRFFTKEERKALERDAQSCYLLAECEEADVLVVVHDEENWQ